MTYKPMPPIEHRFKKGKSGNPAGRPRGVKDTKTVLRELLEMPASDCPDVNKHEFILAKLVKMAEEGDLSSVDRVLDRFEGKAMQPSENRTEAVVKLEMSPDEAAKIAEKLKDSI